MSVLIRSVIAPVAVAALTFAALSSVGAKMTDRLPANGVTTVEKTPAADHTGRPPFADPKRIQSFLAMQADALDLRPWQYSAWNRYAAALAALLSPPDFLPSAAVDPIVASGRFVDEVVARGPAATSLAVAAADLRGQLRPEQIVRASSLIPPPWRTIGRAEALGISNSVESSSPRPSTEREASRIEP